jgi:hypothetical protein
MSYSLIIQINAGQMVHRMKFASLTIWLHSSLHAMHHVAFVDLSNHASTRLGR